MATDVSAAGILTGNPSTSQGTSQRSLGTVLYTAAIELRRQTTVRHQIEKQIVSRFATLQQHKFDRRQNPDVSWQKLLF
jgi:hypothetical protein